MPQFASITIDDREDTPVSHTFVPRTINSDGVATLVESTGVPIGDSKITISSRNTGSKYKGRFVLSIPTMVTETINGVSVPKVTRTAFADLTLTFDASSTSQERENVVGMLADALSADQSLVNGVLTGLEGVY